MKGKILIADDEETVRRTISRLLSSGPEPCEVVSAEDGLEALNLAERENPDLILLDVGMPGKDGLGVLRELRARSGTRLIPVILVTGQAEVSERVGGLEQGADDYVCKPFDAFELRARVERLLSRFRQDIGANPLTRLPGNPLIEEEVSRRIREKTPFALLYADIDRFKSYNDRYGFAKGDDVIRQTAEILGNALRAGEGTGFLGHVGGDDFALVTDPADAPLVAQKAATLFDLAVSDFYDPDDFAQGCIDARDRLGRRRRVPLIRLSIGIATTMRRAIAHYAEAVQIASEMKTYLKSGPERALSRFAFDRRGA